MQRFPFLTPNFRRALYVVAFALLVSASAYAAKVFKHSAVHFTKKSPQQVEKILRDYANYCEEGCKYSRPGLQKVQLLKYKRSDTSWYTWTHVASTFKDVKYFTHVTIKRNPDHSFSWLSQQVTDEKLIAKLEKLTGKPHSPIFDDGVTRITVEKDKKGSKFTQNVSITISGFISNFSSKIYSSMKKSFEATFKNLDK